MNPDFGRGTFHNWDNLSPYAYGEGGTEVFAQMMAFVAMMTFVAIALMVFQVWLFYRIFSKAGYNGWWGLLSLVPGVGLMVVLLILAFDRWPSQIADTSFPTKIAMSTPSTPTPNPFVPYADTVSQPVVPPVTPEPPIPPVTQAAVPSEPPVPPSSDVRGDENDLGEGSA